MFSVIVIDDESLVRIGLKSMIDWSEHGFEIIGEAANGQAGYEMIKELKPDLVISDIKMPIMDGLEMIESVAKLNLNTKFILLTGFNEFELARQAMKLGVSDYIVKLELEQEKLIDTLNKVKDRLSNDIEKKHKSVKIEKLIRSNNYAVREEFFKKVIGKVITDSNEIKEELNYLDIKLDFENFSCAAIQLLDSGKLKSYEEEEINLLEFSILNIVDEIINDKLEGYTFKWIQNEYIIVFSDENNLSSGLARMKIQAVAERIIVMLKQYFNVDVSVAVSNVYKGISNISKAYSECVFVLKQCFYTGTGKVAFFSDIYKESEHEKNDFIRQVTNDIVKYIDQNNTELIRETFESIIDVFNKCKVSKSWAYDMCAKIAYLIDSVFEKEEGALEQIFGEKESIIEIILKLKSLQEMVMWLEKVEQGLCSYLERENQDQNNKVVAMAKKIVEENLQNTINLSEVAERLNMSTGYFSTIFKKIAGVGFTEYVTEAKINKAKKLFKEGNYKIYEIAQLTGYENAYYFSKVFKKVTGMTPSEFLDK